MRHAKRSVLVPYSAEQMFRLVDEAEHYPEFLPWCASAVVHKREPTFVDATLEMRRGGIRRSFRTNNTQEPGKFIHIRLKDGPFKVLEGDWTFTPVGDEGEAGGCRVELDMRFELESKVLDGLLGRFFEDTLNSLVDAFTRRAGEVYGAGSG